MSRTAAAGEDFEDAGGAPLHDVVHPEVEVRADADGVEVFAYEFEKSRPHAAVDDKVDRHLEARAVGKLPVAVAVDVEGVRVDPLEPQGLAVLLPLRGKEWVLRVHALLVDHRVLVPEENVIDGEAMPVDDILF